MHCPVDNETLVMADRNGVEIDYCPKCRGVWLDRGELDKIIERAATPAAPAPREAAPIYQPEPGYRAEPTRHAPRDEPRRKYDDDDDRYHGKKRRRESFLGDLFDF
ncbi:TFIIB-type zinc ribbon-containing protein [Cypionkella sinensis]|uniref:Zf-TFIIB domain-containing protein n=1 Tax=Cypionkella sinensis TaxID=1756043 RepID=A0ABV7J116_9RHOB